VTTAEERRRPGGRPEAGGSSANCNRNVLTVNVPETLRKATEYRDKVLASLK
jgi:hypothetical protein